MAEFITQKQLQELEECLNFDINDFNEILEEYTGIKARPYRSYCYYDNVGNYIGDSNEVTVQDLLQAAYVEVRDNA